MAFRIFFFGTQRNFYGRGRRLVDWQFRKIVEKLYFFRVVFGESEAGLAMIGNKHENLFLDVDFFHAGKTSFHLRGEQFP